MYLIGGTRGSAHGQGLRDTMLRRRKTRSMITHADLEQLIRQALPDARVETHDRTGTLDHYNVTVASAAFSGKSLLDQHRMIYAALADALKDGRLHAVELKTEVGR
jgi:stress-induced morphogen